MYKPRHFILAELVCPHVFNKFGDVAWSFFDEKLLTTIDLLRDQLGPIYVNDWDSKGEFSQRGFRCILCQLVQNAVKNGILYVSPHMTGQAVDFEVDNMTAEKVRQWILSSQNILPYPIRLERNVSWIHLDVRDAGQKVTLFNAE